MPTSPPSSPTGARVLDAAELGEHLDRLLRAALAMCGSRADAEDLVQEVCVKVLAKPRVVRGPVLAYLHGVLRNTFVTQYHTRMRRQTTPVEPEGLHRFPAGTRHDPEAATLHAEVRRAISALPPHYRDAIVAVDVLGLPYREAADALGVAEGTIMSRLYRGRAAVAEQVGAPEPALAA